CARRDGKVSAASHRGDRVSEAVRIGDVEASDFACDGDLQSYVALFFFKQKTAYEIGLGIPAEPLFRSKLVLTSVTPASSAPVLQTPKATSSTLYFDSLTVNAGNGGFLHCIQMDTSVNAANQVVSVGADIAFDADPKFFA